MAEYVHQTLEEMIPELQEMNNLGLFTNKETKIIKKNREGHEYRLRQLTKTKVSYLNYIDYEKKLLGLLKIRRKKIANDSKKREIEKSIADRIHQLYRLATTRFQEDVSLWKQHIDFSKALNEKAYVSRLFEKLLKIHSHNEGLWIESARWESSTQGNGNHTLAREILLQALRVNPESQTIFLELLQMELQLAEQIIKRKSVLGISKTQEETEKLSSTQSDEVRSTQSDDVAELKLAEICYNKGLDIFPGLSAFHMKMLNIVAKFTEAKVLETSIVSDLKRLYPKDAAVLNGLALFNLNNIRNMQASKIKSAVAKCLKDYNQAVFHLSSEEMWTYCLNAHLNLLEVKELSKSHPAILTSLLTMFETALVTGNLAEPLYQELIDILTSLSLPEDAARVADVAVKQHPDSSRLWLAKLRLVAMESENGELLTCLKEAQRRVPPTKSWPLWEFVLNQMATRENGGLEALMESACRVSAREVCCPAKVCSLHWIFGQGNMKKFRKGYTSLKTMRPISLAFYRLYIERECAQIEPNLKLIRDAFEESLAEFGLNEPDLWLNYIEMERKIAKDAVKAGVIKQRALRGLDSHLKETFIRKQMMLGFGWDSENKI